MIAYLNGTFLPLDQARIPVLDRGFVLGDGVYEMVPVYSATPFRLDAHLARLQRSLDGIRLSNPHGLARWSEIIGELIAAQDFTDQSVYIQITRGVAPRDHAFPAGIAPTVFLYAQPLRTASAAQKAAGVCAITAPDPRWQHCDIKAISLLANVLMRQQAVEAGCAETVMLRDGWLTEGAASSIVLVKAGVLIAPPLSPHLLAGITYELVLELAAAHGILHQVRPVAEAELRTADEIWMLSSSREIMPVVRLDGVTVGSGAQGPIARQMDALHQAYKQKVMRALPDMGGLPS